LDAPARTLAAAGTLRPKENRKTSTHFDLRRMQMLSLGLFVRIEAKPGKAKEVAAFLKQGLQMAHEEATTPLWFALRLGPSTFGVFDAFHDESGRQAHLEGPIARALMAQAPNLL